MRFKWTSVAFSLMVLNLVVTQNTVTADPNSAGKNKKTKFFGEVHFLIDPDIKKLEACHRVSKSGPNYWKYAMFWFFSTFSYFSISLNLNM